MNHAITIGGLLLFVGALIGVAIAVIGGAIMFAGGMSDAPAAGDAAGKTGCIFMVGGLLVACTCIGGLIL